QFPNVESTQQEAKNLYKKSRRELLVVADQQSLGVGKIGREWISQLGDVTFSLVIRPRGNKEDFAQLCFIMCLAVGRAIIKHAPYASIRYKWVNDILLGDSKVGGVLLELLDDGALVIGVGVNLRKRDDWGDLLATSLQESNVGVSRADFISEVLHQFDKIYDQWLKMGFLSIQNEWMRRAYGVN